MGDDMSRQKLLIGGALALALAAGACNRDAKDTRKEAIKEDVKVADKAAAVEKERSDEITRLSDRVAQLERAYSEKTAVLATGKRIATSSLREEVQEDVDNVKLAVTNLSTTTADNWWEREEGAMRATIDDVAADVKRFAGHVAEPAPAAPGHALDTVKVKGARETELNDTRQRVKKIASDLDRLAGASADDWWTVSRDRVRDYIDRVEASVRRLDDNKPHT
jgi:hypothetical protein